MENDSCEPACGRAKEAARGGAGIASRRQVSRTSPVSPTPAHPQDSQAIRLYTTWDQATGASNRALSYT